MIGAVKLIDRAQSNVSVKPDRAQSNAPVKTSSENSSYTIIIYFIEVSYTDCKYHKIWFNSEEGV